MSKINAKRFVSNSLSLMDDDPWGVVFSFLRTGNDTLSILLTCKRVYSLGKRYLYLFNRKRRRYFTRACTKNRLSCVEALLRNGRIHPPNSGLQRAVECGHLEMVNLLLRDSRIDPSHDNNRALTQTVIRGHAEVARALLQSERLVIDNTDDMLRLANNLGKRDIVKVLIEDGRCDPSIDDDRLILWATKKKYVDIIQLIVDDDRVDLDDAMDRAYKMNKNDNILWCYLTKR